MTFDLAGCGDLGEAFAQRAAEHPDRPAVTLYGGSTATAHDTVTYGELDRRARARAARLGQRLAPGDRVLLVLPSGTAFVELYLACAMAGLVAVPVPVPDASAAAGDRVASIVADCAPSLALALAADVDAVAARIADRGQAVPVEPVTSAGTAPASVHCGPGRDALAVLQYSSGSTGRPKGVMLGHGDIVDNVTAFRAAAGIGAADVFGMWIPPHHDMGLFAMLSTALLTGAHAVLMPPGAFLRRPVEWLRMLDRTACTVTAGPSFAYDLCTRLIPDDQLDGLDLSRLRVVINGSEPIHVPTMRAFGERFARAGLRPAALCPGYGLAEATVYVTLSAPDRPATVFEADPGPLADPEHPALVPAPAGTGRELAGHGTPGGTRLRIVDPATSRPMPAGAVGEIWLSGRGGIGRGYWNQPELSERTFGARLDGDPPGAAGWLRTGDLGAVVQGELFITGRRKEIMIVRGRNLFPQDLEQEARAAHPALTGLFGAAFGVAAPDERVVLVHEVQPRTPAADLPQIAAAVIRRLTVAFGVPVRNVLLVRRGAVPRTTSGKIQRTATRDRLLAGGLRALHAELDPEVRRLSAPVPV